MVDEKDKEIIEALKKNARLSEQAIAKETKIPFTTVHNRLKKLRETKTITGFGVRLDYAKLGLPLVAYVLVKALPGVDQRQLLLEIAKIPSVYEAAMVTGDFDILFKARVASMDELNRIVVQRLRMQKSVGDTRTMISYETIER